MDPPEIVLDLAETAMNPVSEEEEEEEANNSFSLGLSPSALRSKQDEELLKTVSEQTLPLFDMPHRSLSNVTLCPAMHFSWHNIHVYLSKFSRGFPFKEDSAEKGVNKEKEIVSNVFGVAYPGQVLAIMASSGAGKTTLLNVLSQRNLQNMRVEGSVKVNGLRVGREFMRRVSAYVEQDDSFIGSLTVREQLQFHALLRMGKRYSRKEQHRRVELVMKELGLLTVADTVIATRYRSGLSGGEKKRLSFASEILTSPPILLCDEPTSGLDSFLAFQVVSVLKKLAERKGMTIILTIHQPSSQVFQLFDRIYLMADGRTAFCGTPSEAAEAWATLGRPIPLNFNPADHYISTLAVPSGKEEEKKRAQVMAICNAFAVSTLGRAVKNESRTGEVGQEGETLASSEEGALWRKKRNDEGDYDQYKSTWWQQLRILTWRVALTTLRDPSILYVQLFEAILIAVLTGMVYVGNSVSQSTILNINGSLFQLIVNLNFLFIYNVVHTFCREVPKFLREHQSGLYRVDAYFLAKNLAELPQYTLYACIFSSILYWMSGLVPRADSFGLYVLVAVLVHHVALSFSYAVSCSFPSVALATSIMPLFTTPLMAFSGFFINTASLPFYFMPFKFLSYIGYGYEALAINQWTHIDFIPGCNSTMSSCSSDGYSVLSRLSFSASNFTRNLILIFFFTIVLRLIAFFALFLRTRRR